MAWTAFNEFVARVAESAVRGQNPIQGGYRVLLLSSLTPTRTLSKAQIIAAELVQLNGYARQVYAPGVGAYDVTDQRYEFPQVETNFYPSGASWVVSGAVLMAESQDVSSWVVTSVNTTSDRLTVTGHGRADGDEVVVTSDDTLIGGVMPETLYYAKAVDADTLELYADAGLISKVDLTTAGSGTQYLRNAKGQIALFDAGVSGTFGDGSTNPVRVDWVFFNGGYVPGT